MTTQTVLTTSDVARFCSVSQRTVVQWISEGKINVYRTPGKHSRIRRKDFVDFLKRFNMPVPEEFRDDADQKRILIVDDDKGVVSMLQRILEGKENFAIEVAYDGFSAGLKFNAFKPDLIILDIKMPKMDGLEVCSRIRKDLKNEDVKIIVISGHTDQYDTETIMDYGANAFFSKPFNTEELKEKIEELLELNREAVH